MIRNPQRPSVNRISRTDLIYSKDDLQMLRDLGTAPEPDYREIIRIVEQLVEC